MYPLLSNDGYIMSLNDQIDECLHQMHNAKMTRLHDSDKKLVLQLTMME